MSLDFNDADNHLSGIPDAWYFDRRDPDPEDLADETPDNDLRDPAMWQDCNPWREPIGLQPPDASLWAPPAPIGAAVLGDSVQQP